MELITFYFVCVGVAIVIGIGRLFLSNESFSLSDIVAYAITSIIPIANILLVIATIIDWSSKIPNITWDGKQKRFVERE